MIYKFSQFLQLNYSELEKYIDVDEEITKNELLDKCSGEIAYDLLQGLKELVFDKVGKTPAGELYIA